MSDLIVRDSNGNLLQDGDDVTVIKDLKLKGTSQVLKRGTAYKGIKLTDNKDEVEVRQGRTTLVLRVEFLKKV